MVKIAYMGIKGLPSKGGAERVVEAIVARLKNRYEIVVYCNRRYTPPETRIPDVDIVRIPSLPGKHLQPLTYFIFSGLHALVWGSADIIHIHTVEACIISPILKIRFPIIATEHCPAYLREKWGKAAKLFLKLMDYFYIHFPNKLTSVSLEYSKFYSVKSRREVTYIPNGVDFDMPVDPIAAQNRLRGYGITNDFILFMAGRIEKTKGCDLLLRAFREIEADEKLVVLGDSQMDQGYTQELMEYADERVCFIPFIADKGELFGILSKAKLFVFPSLVEAMSMALLEAASLGVPIICSDIPANTAVLPSQAILFRSGDRDDLREKLEWAIQHPEKMKSVGKKAQAWVREKFSWDIISKEYDHLYRSLYARIKK